ncbi:methyltransferase domain-containing protein [Pholiota molesta]|nr:methyltransferase domain-containing protein [Pholiota molesta]
MSPKKAHEVARMAAYVVALVRASSFPEESLHIVDVGAGQGYLTRALKARLPQAHVLALDADEAQTAGAQKWERRVLQGVEPPIAHRTVLIGEGTLLRAVDEWIDEEGGGKGTAAEENGARAPVPVLFVALHACGSLTPDVLRAFTAARQRTSPASAWYPAAAVVVGCCYNLMHPSDFPLSIAYRTHATPPDLPPAAFHLAAQIPSTWVVWRALLERALQNAAPTPASSLLTISDTSDHLPANKHKSATVPAHWPRRPEHPHHRPNTHNRPAAIDAANAHLTPASGIGMTPALRRLGRLRDAAYADSWGAFLALAAERMGVVFPEERGKTTPLLGMTTDDEDQAILGALPHALRPQARALAALHVLRCVVGVLVESAVLRDRAAWIQRSWGSKTGVVVLMDR